MQAITIAIGKAGISFFAQQLLASKITQILSSLVPPDKTLNVQQIDIIYSTATNIVVNLTQGSLSQFQPALAGAPVQQTDGSFQLTINAGNFNAVYNWNEQYVYTYCYNVMGTIICNSPENKNNNYTYTQAFNLLSLLVSLQFSFNASNNAWQIQVTGSQANATPGSPTIPKDSVLQNQDPSDCGFSSHVDDATAQAISAIDFATPINKLIDGLIKSIPGSGDLGDGIVYNFSIGDSGLLFPGNDGIQMGVTGGASYQGTAFSEPNPPSLPLPAPLSDSDTHHLNMYVSNYEVDALNWAYSQAGKLNLVLNPQDLPNPAALSVSTYTALEPTLAPYAAFVMQAQVTQLQAPVTSFQTAYIFGPSAMALLKTQLSTQVYGLIQGLPSNAFLSQSDLDNFLTTATVPSSDFAKIEAAGIVTAMVLTQSMNFNLVIQNEQPTMPYIKIQVDRIDVLTDLQLGLNAHNNQTMQFGFASAKNSATFIESSIPGFNGILFSEVVWPATAETNYATALQDMGATGVPLPIMAGLSFDFTNAQLSVQEGYVSILANVQYNNA